MTPFVKPLIGQYVSAGNGLSRYYFGPYSPGDYIRGASVYLGALAATFMSYNTLGLAIRVFNVKPGTTAGDFSSSGRALTLKNATPLSSPQFPLRTFTPDLSNQWFYLDIKVPICHEVTDSERWIGFELDGSQVSLNMEGSIFLDVEYSDNGNGE